MDTNYTSYIKEANTIITLGTQDGEIDRSFVEINPGTNIYAFEPRDKFFYIFSKMISLNNIENIVLLNNALYNIIGQLKIQNDEPQHVEMEDGIIIKNNDIYECLTIDSLNLLSCDIIFLDLEDFEYPAIIGGLNTIKKYKPIIIFKKKNPNLYDIFEKISYKVDETNNMIIAKHIEISKSNISSSNIMEPI